MLKVAQAAENFEFTEDFSFTVTHDTLGRSPAFRHRAKCSHFTEDFKYFFESDHASIIIN